MMSNKTEQNLLVTVGGESLSGGVSNKASFTFNSSLLLKDYSLTHNAVLKLLDVGRNVIRKFLLVLAGRIAQVDQEAR